MMLKHVEKNNCNGDRICDYPLITKERSNVENLLKNVKKKRHNIISSRKTIT